MSASPLRSSAGVTTPSPSQSSALSPPARASAARPAPSSPRRPPPSPPVLTGHVSSLPSRTNWTRLVPRPVPTGHVSSLAPRAPPHLNASSTSLKLAATARRSFACALASAACARAPPGSRAAWRVRARAGACSAPATRGVQGRCGAAPESTGPPQNSRAPRAAASRAQPPRALPPRPPCRPCQPRLPERLFACALGGVRSAAETQRPRALPRAGAATLPRNCPGEPGYEPSRRVGSGSSAVKRQE